ncbi:E3 ubiquitin-protein ligase listerin [Escovopsis weberi]|uniref:E3 ubiquitin-protein ligase listerin n=1 Tax=Escovopsis weberi TaxID=150374 RepID=A0A0M9VUX8_ESCWE|nr:E3 ubiquitin-protein ligase listerin [Escovopsis weberi]
MKQRNQTNTAAGRLGGPSMFTTHSCRLSYLAEPPSLDAVSDPNVVVSLKNVLKKDGITKAKGLEDLVQYAHAHPFDKDGGADEAILDFWDEIYPRTSIDNSRRVRELSHTFQLALIRSARKRAEKHIPKVVGTWLAGLYDRDRAASRAAGDGLSSFLNTPEKMTAFWRKCHPQILDYALDGIRETADTLSDERSTSKEDAEAKYHRVVSASLSLVLGLLERLDSPDFAKLRDKYDEFFAEEVVWHSIALSDPAVRKAVCQLLVVCLDRGLPYAQSTVARRSILLGGLKTAQSGSALEYTKALIRLTKEYPDSWSPSQNKGKSLFPKLQQFIAKGSQGGRATFWESVQQLIAILPRDQLRDLSTASGFLSAIKSGISSREEPRTHAVMGWKCYTETAKLFLELFSEEDKLQFVKQQMLPLFDQFLFPPSDRPASVFFGPKFAPSLVEAHLAIIRSSPAIESASDEEWSRLTDLLCERISNSLPEVSREYQSSQEKIGDEGRLWFGLVGEIHKRLSEIGEVLPDQTAGPSKKIIRHSISRLQNRDMKPFGAARILETALSTSQHLFDGDVGQETSAFLRMDAEGSMAKALQSASCRPLLSCLRILGGMPSREAEYATSWSSWVDAALDLTDAPVRVTALSSLLSQEKGSVLAQSSARLQESILHEFSETVKGNADSWELLNVAVTHGSLTDESCRALARSLMQFLETQTGSVGTNLRALEFLVKGRPQIFAQDEALQTDLVAQLLGISEVGDGADSSKALAVRSLLKGGGGEGALPVIGIIHANLERAGPQSLNVSTLLSQAQQAFDAGVPVEDIFPSTNAWMQKLAPFLEQPLNPSLTITNALGGVVTLSNNNSRLSDLRTISRDRKGRSIPLRMALYAAKLLEDKADKSKLPIQFQVELLFIQCLVLQLATDQLTSREYNGLWRELDQAESIAEAENFVAGLRHTINQSSVGASWWDQSSADQTSRVFRGLVNLLKQESTRLDPRGVYSARALSEIVSSLAETQGVPPALEETLLKPALAKAAPETALLSAAILSGLGETLQPSKLASNFCNRLASDVAGASAQGDKTFMTLSLLTLVARVYEAGELPIANNRIVFAVKQITSWLEDEEEQLSAPLCAEICRVLTTLLPCMSSVFGSYWEKSIEFCLDLWDKAAQHPLPDALPFIHASLKLVKTLEGMADANEDLSDALKESAGKRSMSLIELLRLPRGGTSQPLDIVDAMLCREVEKIDIKRIADISDIYELVASESRDIQSAAFSLLHRAIPAEQESRAVDVMLDNIDARLPDELLSLLLDAPTLEKFSDEMLAQFPSSIRCYLLSWKLVFDAFSGSPSKMRSDFTEHLKMENYTSHLLDFTFDVLGHSAANALNLEKVHITAEQIRDYDMKLAEGEADEKSMQWLLVHVFFLTLKYVPSLFKAWYLDCRSKQTRIAVEAWTARYLSPLIISDTLDDVQAWGEQQEPLGAEDPELTVRVLKNAREVTASYAIDEAEACIALKIPSSFPLDGVAVSSVSRVGVRERRWQSWITITQGAIAFSGGNVIDGLQVFKRNMCGALRGQSECAICYSIISTDKRMPDKRCGTCKNLFHRSCLYKWFQTSNQNTCPLCRNPIEYLGSDTKRRQ